LTYPEQRGERPREQHWLLAFVVRALLSAAAIWVAVRVLDGVRSDGEIATYVIAGLVLAAANSLVRPIVTLLAIPLIVLTLGLAYLLVGVLMVALTAALVDGLAIDGFWSAVGAAILVWLVNWGLAAVLHLDDGYRRPPRRSTL
jgi:putative membrane protein